MTKPILAAAALCACALSPIAASAQDEPTAYPSPGEIVAQASASEWIAIAPEDLLVMDLAPDRDGPSTGSGLRRVVIQLMPPPFSQGWIGNIRKLAAAHWWDGTSVNRVQDNYVVQWGDATEAKPLPEGLATVPEREYVISTEDDIPDALAGALTDAFETATEMPGYAREAGEFWRNGDAYTDVTTHAMGWPIASSFDDPAAWPVHCYGMVGVGRDLSPDTGTGAELYTVIGQAPRHLDRNIALVGRVIEGMENLSSLPRGTGDLGFYEDPAQRVPITSVRLASELVPQAEQPQFEFLSTEGPKLSRAMPMHGQTGAIRSSTCARGRRGHLQHPGAGAARGEKLSLKTVPIKMAPKNHGQKPLSYMGQIVNTVGHAVPIRARYPLSDGLPRGAGQRGRPYCERVSVKSVFRDKSDKLRRAASHLSPARRTR